MGTAVLGVLELGLVPRAWPLTGWLTDWKWIVFLVAVLLIIIPPAVAKGTLHLRSRDQSAKKNAELSAALTAIHSRTSNLVSKVRESGRGEATGAYAHHSVKECQAYFAARRTVGGRSVDHSGVHIEVAYYGLTMKQGGAKLERKSFTSDDPNTPRPTISTRGTPRSKKLVEAIMQGEIVWEPDLRNSNISEVFGITSDNADMYSAALAVPVHRDRAGQRGVAGMLFVTTSDSDTLLRSDEPLIRAYAWFLAVAMALDDNISNARSSVPHIIVAAAYTDANNTGGAE